MKVLIISLHEDLRAIGIKYLHYYLLENGHSSSILYLPNFDIGNEEHLKRVGDFVVQTGPEMIGISLMSHRYKLACELTGYLKSRDTAVPIVWGGIHASIAPDTCVGHADYVCIGEGERTLLDLANAIESNKQIDGINNLCFLENGKIRRNPLYPLIDNLDQVPSYEYIPVNSFVLSKKGITKLDKGFFQKYDSQLGKMYGIITTRGCPFSCTYCCNNALSRLYPYNRIRKRSISNIIDQAKTALRDNPEIEYINFQDDCFLANKDEYIAEFCRVYKKEVSKPFIIRGIPIYITEEKIRSLKEAGLSWITLGLQSGSDRTCIEIYKRRSLKKDFLRAAGIIAEHKIAAFYDVILDNPFEEETDVLETVKTFTDTPKPFLPQFFSLVMYYGTELHEKAASEFPESVSAYFNKNYFVLDRKSINSIMRLAPFIKRGLMRKIIHLYEKKPRSLEFKLYLSLANALSLFFFQPIYYFQVVRLSQSGSLSKTLKVLPVYFKEGIWRYILQFR